MNSAWSEPVRLSEITRGSIERRLTPDETTRARIAETLGLDALPALEAEIRLQPWLDGAELTARWAGRVVQTCGVTLEPFETSLGGEFEVRAVPPGSRAAPTEAAGEVVFDPEAPDPPDLLESDEIDPAAYVVEHLALEIDPYPRKPDAVFEPPEAEAETSPFAVLLALKKPGES